MTSASLPVVRKLVVPIRPETWTYQRTRSVGGTWSVPVQHPLGPFVLVELLAEGVAKDEWWVDRYESEIVLHVSSKNKDRPQAHVILIG